MKTMQELKEKMLPNEFEILEALQDYYKNEEEFLTAIANDNDELQDKVNEWADGEIEIYTARVYDWIADNWNAVRNYEEEAIATGANTIEKIGQYCQYMDAIERANESISRAKTLLS